jgi:oxygen-independent coproporphyrinogen-3 oxidase
MSLGVYLSYPLCAQKCTFCNFASGVYANGFEREYLDCLRTEIRESVWDRTPDTVYLGGGTPSRMDPADLAELLRMIPGGPWAEATLEAAPGTITPEKAEAWREAGINRVSLGVQSFSARELARTGRKHTAETVVREVEVLRAAGIANFNVDLIAGLPGQTSASWHTSLSWLAALDAPHVSIYMLEVDEDSRLGNEVLLNGKRYGAPETPSDESVAEFYEAAVRHLAAQDIHRYEISNFARPGRESLHNLKYWKLEPYLGFGADAHSFDGVTRWQNADSPEEYVKRMQASGSAREAGDAARLDQEKFFVGLRLSEGVKPSPDEWRYWNRPIRQFVDQGLLERRGERLRLTDQGVLYSNEVLAEFVEA